MSSPFTNQPPKSNWFRESSRCGLLVTLAPNTRAGILSCAFAVSRCWHHDFIGRTAEIDWDSIVHSSIMFLENLLWSNHSANEQDRSVSGIQKHYRRKGKYSVIFLECVMIFFSVKVFAPLTPIFSDRMVGSRSLPSLSPGNALEFQNILTLTLLCNVPVLLIKLKQPLSLEAHMKHFSVSNSTKEINCSNPCGLTCLQNTLLPGKCKGMSNR